MKVKSKLGALGAVLVAAIVLVGAGGTGLAGADNGQRPQNFTEHGTFPDETFNDKVCDGDSAAITVSDGRFVFHITEFEDGRFHVTGTFRGDFSFTHDGVDYAGHYTGWFGENVNSRNFNGTFTLNGEGKGDDGSKVQVKGLAHFNVSASGVENSFEDFTVTCR